MTRAEAQALLESRDLIALGMRAEEERRRRHGDRVTFVRVSHVRTGAELPAAIPRGAGEVRLSGDQPLEPMLAMVRAAAALADGVPVTGFDVSALCQIASSATPLTTVATALRDAGLSAVSEMRLSRIEALGLDAARVLRQVIASGLPVVRLTLDDGAAQDPLIVFERVEALAAGLGDSAPKAFAPLPRAPSSTPSTGYDDVARVALARLIVQSVPSIQVDWGVYGPKLAQVSLLFGADDLDNVTPGESAANLLGPRRAPLEEVRRNIRAASLEPVERNGRFEALTAA